MLDLATDDLIGLWEILPSAREIWSGASDEELRARISAALLELVRMGLVEFYMGRDFSGEHVHLSEDAITRELSEPRNWDGGLPTTERHVRFGATELGQERYFAHRTGE